MAFNNTQSYNNALTYNPVNSLAPTQPTFVPQFSHNPYSPLLRRLSIGDLGAVRLSDGTRVYYLKQSHGVSLWWTLNSIADDISTAGVSPIRFDPAYPAAARSHIPEFLFQRIGLPRPEVLDAVELETFNPLYMLTDIPTIVACWTQLQHVGLKALAWIKEAKSRCETIGIESGWDWSFYRTQLLELPANPTWVHPSTFSDDNTLGLRFDNTASSPVDRPMSDSVGSLSPLSNIVDLQSFNRDEPEASLDLVLHPIHSRYAQANPDYDVFSGTTQIDNGYVEEDIKMSCPLDDEYSLSSDTSTSTGDFSSCYSLSQASSPGNSFYYTRLPVIVGDAMDVDACGSTSTATATSLAAQGYSALRSDNVNA